MIRSETSVRSEIVRQDVKHTLFVEGKENSIDPIVMRDLLGDKIIVKPLGPSSNIRGAAQALAKHHPEYYFLIDRDHHDQAFVQKCWNHFPDPELSNLLVWFRRELENYFLIPEYLLKSSYFTRTEDELKTLILQKCQERIYLEAANLVIIKIRETLKENWIKIFDNIEKLNTKDNAINKLLNLPEFGQHKRRLSQLVGDKRLKNRFLDNLEFLTGGKNQIEYGTGKWLEMVQGKAVLPTVINKCFRVKDKRGKLLQDSVRVNQVAKDLVRKPLDEQPCDFQLLFKVINSRITEQ